MPAVPARRSPIPQCTAARHRACAHHPRPVSRAARPWQRTRARPDSAPPASLAALEDARAPPRWLLEPEPAPPAPRTPGRCAELPGDPAILCEKGAIVSKESVRRDMFKVTPTRKITLHINLEMDLAPFIPVPCSAPSALGNLENFAKGRDVGRPCPPFTRAGPKL